MLVFGENLLLHSKPSLEKALEKIIWKEKKEKAPGFQAEAQLPSPPPACSFSFPLRAAQETSRGPATPRPASLPSFLSLHR
jgi:hypothetical protein